MKVLIVVDMQNDFIDGSLGTKEAVGIVDRVAEVMDSFDGAVICTRDTHFADYLETSEGRKLPVEHCIEGTKGHALQDTIQKMAEKKQAVVTNKITFGAMNGLRLDIHIAFPGKYPIDLDTCMHVSNKTIPCLSIFYNRSG